jgi:GNAT superfamily N-acetyltransferase
MSSFNFLIRDALADDIQNCLSLDHSYETDSVWQMNIQTESNGWRVTFHPERLPRPIEIHYPSESQQLERVLYAQQGFFVACAKDEPSILGYALASYDNILQHATIHSIVVSRPFRRHKVGIRLLNVIKRWSQEQDANALYCLTQTKNMPAILFCQRSGLSFCGYNDRYFSNGDIAVTFGQTLR